MQVSKVGQEKVATNLREMIKIKKAVIEKRDSKGSSVHSYIKGKAETLKRVFSKHKINVCCKPHQTLSQILGHPKGKTSREEECGR